MSIYTLYTDSIPATARSILFNPTPLPSQLDFSTLPTLAIQYSLPKVQLPPTSFIFESHLTISNLVDNLSSFVVQTLLTPIDPDNINIINNYVEIINNNTFDWSSNLIYASKLNGRYVCRYNTLQLIAAYIAGLSSVPAVLVNAVYDSLLQNGVNRLPLYETQATTTNGVRSKVDLYSSLKVESKGLSAFSIANTTPATNSNLISDFYATLITTNQPATALSYNGLSAYSTPPGSYYTDI